MANKPTKPLRPLHSRGKWRLRQKKKSLGSGKEMKQSNANIASLQGTRRKSEEAPGALGSSPHRAEEEWVFLWPEITESS